MGAFGTLFAPRIARFHLRPVFTTPVGNSGLGPILGFRVLDADTGRLGPQVDHQTALAIARVRNSRQS